MIDTPMATERPKRSVAPIIAGVVAFVVWQTVVMGFVFARPVDLLSSGNILSVSIALNVAFAVALMRRHQ